MLIKSKLIAEIAAQQTDISEHHINLAVNQILIALTDALVQQERIEIRDFGSFSIHQRLAGERRNPKTGVKVAKPASYWPHFKPGKTLRALLNQPATTV